MLVANAVLDHAAPHTVQGSLPPASSEAPMPWKTCLEDLPTAEEETPNAPCYGAVLVTEEAVSRPRNQFVVSLVNVLFVVLVDPSEIDTAIVVALL